MAWGYDENSVVFIFAFIFALSSTYHLVLLWTSVLIVKLNNSLSGKFLKWKSCGGTNDFDHFILWEVIITFFFFRQLVYSL